MLYVHRCTLYNDEAHFKRYTRNNVATTPCYYSYPKINSRGKVTYKKHHEQKKNSSQFIALQKFTELSYHHFFLTAKITMTELNDQNVKIFVQNCINCSYHLIEAKPMNTHDDKEKLHGE